MNCEATIYSTVVLSFASYTLIERNSTTIKKKEVYQNAIKIATHYQFACYIIRVMTTKAAELVATA